MLRFLDGLPEERWISEVNSILQRDYLDTCAENPIRRRSGVCANGQLFSSGHGDCHGCGAVVLSLVDCISVSFLNRTSANV